MKKIWKYFFNFKFEIFYKNGRKKIKAKKIFLKWPGKDSTQKKIEIFWIFLTFKSEIFYKCKFFKAKKNISSQNDPKKILGKKNNFEFFWKFHMPKFGTCIFVHVHGRSSSPYPKWKKNSGFTPGSGFEPQFKTKQI